MSKWDKEYIKLCKKILKNGTLEHNRTGIDTIKLPGYFLEFDLAKEFPVLTTKQLFFKNAITEMLWFYQAQSNDVRWLQERNNHIWDEWEIDEDGKWKAIQNVLNENGELEKKEVENFGIVEINNAGASKKLKNNQDAGYEKNVTTACKKLVKSQVSHVEDYFDFCFRPDEKQVVRVEEEKAVKKTVAEKKVAACKRTVAKKETGKKVSAKKSQTTTKSKAVAKSVDFEQKVQEERIISFAEACERQEFDEQANKIVWVARMGALFDCDATMMN